MSASTQYHFRVRDHLILPNVSMVEVWRGEDFVGTINAHEIGGKDFLTFTSERIAGARIDRRDPKAPGIIVALDRLAA
jgi:hypothetical protein